MRTVAQVTWNTFTKWGSHAISGMIGVLLVPFLLNELGKEAYGLIALVGVIVSVSGLADLGLRQGLGRQLAEMVTRQDNQRYNELVSTAIAVFIAIGVLTSCVIVATAPYIVKVFRISVELTPESIFLVRLYGSVSLMISFVNPVFTAILNSHNRFDISNNILSGISILRGLGIFLVLGLTHTGLYGWAGVMVISQVLGMLTRIYSTYHFKPDIQVRLRDFKVDSLKKLFSLGTKLYVIHLANLISTQANPIIITQFFGPVGVSVYRPGIILNTQSLNFVNAFRQQLFPLTTNYSTNGKLDKLQEILIKATRYSTLMAVVVCVMLIVFAEPIMKVWIGNTSIGEHYQTGALILILTSINSLFNSTIGSQWAVLLGMNRLNFVVWTSAISGILNVLFSIYLVGYTSLGIIGVVIPSVILSAIRRPIVTVYTAKVCQLSPWRYFCKTYIRPLVVMLFMGIIASAARYFIQPSSVNSILACLAIIGATWFPLCWFIGLEVSDRKTFLNLMTNFRKKAQLI